MKREELLDKLRYTKEMDRKRVWRMVDSVDFIAWVIGEIEKLECCE